jgi:4-hydroxy-2-oxoheptanedioate aldolase
MNAVAAIDRLRAPGTKLGLWAQVPHVFVIEAICRTALADFVCLDLQHAVIDESSFTHLAKTVVDGGSVPIARVPSSAPGQIGKVLDQGAFGVIVPMVETRQQAEDLVAACRYSPAGIRSYGPVRAEFVMGTSDQHDLERVLAFAMIETRKGAEAADEIASVPGLDGIMLGPSDLSLSLGYPARGSSRKPEVVAAMTEVVAACKRHGILAATNAVVPEAISASDSYDLIALGTDLMMLGRGMTSLFTAARQSLGDTDRQ